MHSMKKRHDVQLLRRAGKTQREIEELVEVSVRSVRRIVAEAEVTSLDDAVAREVRGVGRPSKVQGFRKWVENLLSREPELPGLEILRRARVDGYAGGKSQFYGLVAQLRPEPPPKQVLIRFEGLPGEFTQHDFGEVDVGYVDGSKERVHFFASRLKWSRWSEVSLVPNQQTEALCRGVVDHMAAFGGVPLMAVFDRPKTIVIAWDEAGRPTQWNASFRELAFELGMGVELCWPYRAQEKGAVENLVGWVKKSFFKVRKFLDRKDLEEQLRQWLREVNEDRPNRETNIVPRVRLAEDQARLRPLRVTPEKLELRVPVFVGPTARVWHLKHQYSMPAEAMGIAGTLYLGRNHVRIVAGRFERLHPRCFAPDEHSILPEDRASALASVAGRRGKHYLKRQQILELGPEAIEYLTEQLHRRPHLATGDVDSLHLMLDKHGEDALRAAMIQALRLKVFGPGYIASLLPATRPVSDRTSVAEVHP